MQHYLQCVVVHSIYPQRTERNYCNESMMHPLSIFDHLVLYRCKILSNTMEQRKASIVQRTNTLLSFNLPECSGLGLLLASSVTRPLDNLCRWSRSCVMPPIRPLLCGGFPEGTSWDFLNSNMPSDPAASVVTVSWRSAISCFVQFPFQFAFLCQPANVRL